MQAGEKEAILAHLREVLASRPFQRNRRARVYLHFVVTETVEGRAEALSKTNIGIAVFGRDDEVTRARIRDKADDVDNRLTHFYHFCGYQGTLWFALDWNSLAPIIGPAMRPRPPWPGIYFPPPVTRKPKTWTPVLPGLGTIALAVAIGLFTESDNPKKPVSPPIWNPFLHRDRVVILCEPFPTEQTRLLGSLFREHGSDVDSKMGTQITRTDIRFFPTVLFRGCNSPWSEELANGLRFQFEMPFVADTQSGKKWPGVLVTRILDSGYGQPLMMMRGLPVDPERVVEHLNRETDLSQHLGPGWITKNFQLVVENPDGLPSRIVAGHSW
jgi:hypothetical protein